MNSISSHHALLLCSFDCYASEILKSRKRVNVKVRLVATLSVHFTLFYECYIFHAFYETIYVAYRKHGGRHIYSAEYWNHLVVRNLLPVNASDCSTFRVSLKMGHDATKPVIGVSDKARLKPVASATETN